MAGGYAVSVCAFIDGSSYSYGEHPSQVLRRQVLTALGRMHAVAPPGFARRDNLEVPLRVEFFAALDEPAVAWNGGPYSEGAGRLLRAARRYIDELFAAYDELVPTVLAGHGSWVATHGEPHAGNVMRSHDGAVKLIDWDTAAVGPRQRDLWMIEPRTDEDWLAYTSGGGTASCDPAAMELYRRWWALSEICDYTVTLRAPHADDDNTRIAWRELQTYLAA